MIDKEPRLAVNCYSKGEGAFMAWGQRLRARMLGPLLEMLGGNGVRAGHVTFLSLLCGLVFCPFFIAGYPVVALVFLLLHVLLDGLDGPLARYLGRDGARGSFTDTASDQVVVSAVTIAMVYTGMVGAWPGGCYLFLYTIVVTFAMIRNAIKVPYSWLFRPRFLVFGWIAVEVFLWPGTINYLLWGATLLLGLKAVTGFLAIRRKL
ncbi:MAG: CDP-alcohol phosphatidyltransferase family protein [Verrucomicrobiales bacterium]|nr:CDP-alcohol phosphatidyltransferase family protein [Verrucomicrobiales bacterium]